MRNPVFLRSLTLSLGLTLSGHKDVALYDGSWAEWGRPGDTDVATGDS